jgi:hypothetical protein
MRDSGEGDAHRTGGGRGRLTGGGGRRTVKYTSSLCLNFLLFRSRDILPWMLLYTYLFIASRVAL